MASNLRINVVKILIVMGLGAWLGGTGQLPRPTPAMAQPALGESSEESEAGSPKTKYEKDTQLWKKARPKARPRGDTYRQAGGMGFIAEDFALYDTATVTLSKGKYNQAIKEFDAALQKNSKLAEAYFNRGLAYALTGRYEQAASDFNKFIALEPRDPDAYYNRGLAYVKKGQYDQALADFSQALKLNPQDAQVHYARGFAYYKKGQPDKATSDRQMALNLDPDYVKQAQHQGSGELDAYGELLQRPGKAPGSQALVLAANKMDDDRQVAQVRSRGQGELASQGPGKDKEETYWKERKRIRKSLRQTAQIYFTAEEFSYHQGFDHLSRGQLDQAIAEFSKALANNPKFAEPYINRGLAYGRKGQYDLAIADFHKFIELEHRDPEAYYNRGLAYAKKGQYDQALADFNQALKLSPGDGQAFYLRGFVHYKQGQADQARADLQTVLKLNPGYVKEVQSRGAGEMDTYGEVLQGKRQPAEAQAGEPAAKKAEVSHKQQALALARKGQYGGAITEFGKALEANPKDAEAYNSRGSTYTLEGRYDQALADFKKALELNPKYAKAYYNRALAYYYKGEYAQALADLNKALELNPKDAEAYNNRGLAYDQQGQYDRAVSDFDRALTLNPKLADAYLNKAAACEKAGRKEEAREAYEAFIRYAPPEAAAQVESAKQKLNRL